MFAVGLEDCREETWLLLVAPPPPNAAPRQLLRRSSQPRPTLHTERQMAVTGSGAGKASLNSSLLSCCLAFRPVLKPVVVVFPLLDMVQQNKRGAKAWPTRQRSTRTDCCVTPHVPPSRWNVCPGTAGWFIGSNECGVTAPQTLSTNRKISWRNWRL